MKNGLAIFQMQPKAVNVRLYNEAGSNALK
jgi:hypothetical protein